jgi:hypothetical protein
MIQIQATFSGYGARPCTLFSAYDPASRIVVVSAEVDYRPARRAQCLVITNDPQLERDRLFSEADLGGAIRAFYALKSGMARDSTSARLLFGERAQRANPEAVIERDGYDAHGARYRVAEGVSCAQVAALATCLYVTVADTIEDTVAMAADLAALRPGYIITV